MEISTATGVATGGASAAFSPPKITPAPDDAAFLTALRTLIANPIASIPARAYRATSLFDGRMGGRVAYLTDPEMIEDVLVRRASEFPKSRIDDRVLRPAFGDSLLTADGASWRWKRRLAAPAFAPAALRRLTPAMAEPFIRQAAAWEKAAATTPAAPVLVSDAMTAGTLAVIQATLFSRPGELDAAALSDDIDAFVSQSSWVAATALLGLPSWTPHPGKGRMTAARRRLRGAVGAMIAARRAGAGPCKTDLTADLMAATDPETGAPLADDDLVDMLLTLVAAGHETSANALAWTLYCLAGDTAAQERAAAEAAAAFGVLTPEDGAAAAESLAAGLARAPFLEACVKEAMRLFPPAPAMARRARKTVTLRGRDGAEAVLRSGRTVVIPIYALHRHEALWSRPDAFDPHRFLERDPPRTVYMPFGAGPRICVGAKFAMMEMTLALGALLPRLRFAHGPETECAPLHRITLRPRNGMLLRVAPR